MIYKKYIVAVVLYILCAGSNLAEPVRLATTTSTDNSGLMQRAIALF